MHRPPFQITPRVLQHLTQIHEYIGQLKDLAVGTPSIQLRRQNKIQTVHHSLAIEGNSLSEDQITAVLENKRVLGPKKQIIEVQNALQLYDELQKFNPGKESDLLKAHSFLMRGLVSRPGSYRLRQVGILKGEKVTHVAPPAKQVPHLMEQLFEFIQKDPQTSWIIKACVFHYELEFIHPFEDGNGRMGRLWQQLLLMRQSPVFEYISTETLIHQQQKRYYEVLEKSDRAGDSTLFLEFSLELILKCLKALYSENRIPNPKSIDRIGFALNHFQKSAFSRKEYIQLFPAISTATASRDLANAVKAKLLLMSGEKAKAVYRKK